MSRAEPWRPGSLLEFHLLVALAAGPLHGYALAEAVSRESGGAIAPRAGSLYRVVARLVGAGLVAEAAPGDATTPHPGLARRYYELTAAGRRALATEALRLRRSAEIADDRLRRLAGSEP
jgi:DNA-binding PadR family transcriptional regulator